VINNFAKCYAKDSHWVALA